MTEAEWLACTELRSLRGCLFRQFDKVSARKMRLFGCACCRQVMHLLSDNRSHQAIEVSEQFADGLATRKDLAAARQGAFAVVAARDQGMAGGWRAARAAAQCALHKANEAGRNASDEAASVLRQPGDDWFRMITNGYREQVPLLRDIFGNPFRPVKLDPSWRTRTVLAIAQVIYDERDFSTLPVLSDALEDAGCENADVLNHCRQPGEHVRGCWVVDLVFGKE